MQPSRDEMTIGFLHLGSERGGIHRDGRMLAAQLAARPRLRVRECAVDISEAGVASLRKLIGAARALAGADVTIVPYSPNRLWAAGWAQLIQLVVALLVFRRTVIVLHDVYPSRRWLSPNWWAVSICAGLAQGLVFHEQHEMATLRTLRRRGVLFRIPLSVEPISLPSRRDARAQLGVSESTVVLAMVGWIHPRKNCERAIHTLARLPESATLWLIGSATPGAEPYRHKLRCLAAELGVAERVSITGYVDDDELRHRLACIDVALVPYTAISASASLSTLVGARRPIVASDLAVTRELHELTPSAIRIADHPGEVAQLVESIVAEPPGPNAFEPLLLARSAEAVADLFEDLCRGVMRGDGPARDVPVASIGSDLT